MNITVMLGQGFKIIKKEMIIMLSYSIMPLDENHVDEICLDIKNMKKNGVADCALFMMKLVPEGNPPIDKAKIYCDIYDVFRDKLSEMGIECGILAQSTIGHGYPLDNMFSFQRYTNLTNGVETNVCCPYDEGFRSYIRDAMRTLALHRPKTIMVDDDFRLMERPGRGCGCQLHIGEFNRISGKSFTREELYKHLICGGKENERFSEMFVHTQYESLIGAAHAMREGVDSVDDRLPMSYCACGNNAEAAEEIAQILAGKGNPTVVRINNGNYTPAGARNFSEAMIRAATQIAHFNNKVNIVLAETDTCPQNRYSTGAQSLHSHYTGSILEGVSGAKHWITRLIAYEPASGKAYREILRKNHRFYNKLAQIVPNLDWLGCRIPLSGKRDFSFGEKESVSGWALCVLERLGLPLYFSKETGGAVFLNGNADAKFTDEQIREMFKGPLFLSSDTAKNLINRGFIDCLGVNVEPWTVSNISGELLSVNSNVCAIQPESKQLIPLNDEVIIDSVAFHTLDGKKRVSLFPAVTVYNNSLGGTTVVFSGTPQAPFTYIKAFSFLNESRKLQLITILKRVKMLPVYYPDDAEVYLRAANMNDGRLFVAFFNIGLDPIDKITLCTEKSIVKVSKLTHDGTEEQCTFHKDGDKYIVDTPAYTLNPVILFLEQ